MCQLYTCNFCVNLYFGDVLGFVSEGLGPLSPLQAGLNPNGLNPNVTVGRNSVGIAAPGDSGP